MILSERVHTFGQAMISRYGERVHKIAIDAGFTCPNRDGSKGRKGCTFCSNISFSPNGRRPPTLPMQIETGRQVIYRRTRAKKYLAYFQAYTNTYANVKTLQALYDEALKIPGIIGIAVGTRPDCVPKPVLNLLSNYQQQGYEVWLELGLQSSFDSTLEAVNRGHTYADYITAIHHAHQHGLQVCTHLIVGLPGETKQHNQITLDRVLELGVAGLKLHPLHVVKGTQLAKQWLHGKYTPWTQKQYVDTAADLIERTPEHIFYHRVTATANKGSLLAPAWCQYKWRVLNDIEQELRQRNSSQGKTYYKLSNQTERIN